MFGALGRTHEPKRRVHGGYTEKDARVILFKSRRNNGGGGGSRSVPAVVINGKFAECCAGRGPNEHDLRSALA
jgi:hypothetical protein